MMFGYGWHAETGWAWIGSAGMAVFWIALLALVIFGLTRAFSHPMQSSSGSTGDDQATQLLRERFARGEISEEAYQQARRVLRETKG